MIFITNRSFKEGPSSTTQEGEKFVKRKVTFDLDDNQAGQSISFCERKGKNNYSEIGSTAFMDKLKKSKEDQLLFYIHGFSNLPEVDIFPRANTMQVLFDAKKQSFIKVIPIIWPCDNDMGILKDYWDDQKAADASSFAFSRVLEKFMKWRESNSTLEKPCLKRINILAHSMGNRVLRQTLVNWAKYDQGGKVPMIFKNIFLVAADIVNESLERDNPGSLISQSCRNVVVYYASDDLALRASKVANLKNRVASRRLGHTGPENIDAISRNVYSIDCDDVNSRYDKLKGHSYFLEDEKDNPGKVFMHLFNVLDGKRVEVDDPVRRTKIITP